MLDYLPVQPKAGVDWNEFQNVDWETADQEQKEKFLDNFESVKMRKIKYDKPIAIIINPNSGKKILK